MVPHTKGAYVYSLENEYGKKLFYFEGMIVFY